MVTEEYPTTRSVAWHEAHHASSLLVDNWPPLVASVYTHSPNGYDRTVGHVKLDWGVREPTDPANQRIALVAVLMGPISEADPEVDTVSWPIDPAEWISTSDGKTAQHIAEFLQLDQVRWGQFVHRANVRSRNQRFRRLAVEVAQALERDEEIYQPQMIEIAERIR
jgi:hypothetical protein